MRMYAAYTAADASDGVHDMMVLAGEWQWSSAVVLGVVVSGIS